MAYIFTAEQNYCFSGRSGIEGAVLTCVVSRCASVQTDVCQLLHKPSAAKHQRETLSLPLPSLNASGTNIVAIDNKIEQAMDLVKSHLMYAVREEVEVLKEQIKELYERNSVLERENAVLKSLANSEQLSQLATQGTWPAAPPSGSAGQTATVCGVKSN
uniref:TSC22 domain family member 2 n=1 Tax=Oryzias melastigma TaxID=30732 RepID=A0A3B3BKK3_ORYME